MTATNKWLLISESHGDSNRCTPCRKKLDQHVTHFPCSVRIWSTTIRISRGPHIATFHTVVNRFEQIHCTREEWLLTQSTAHRSSDPWVRTQLLSHNSQWNSGEKSSLCWQPTTRLTGPYHRHAIDMFNTCSRGPFERSLIDTGRGYNLGGAGLPGTTPRPSQPVISPFHLRAPSGLHFNQVPLIKPRIWVLKNLWTSHGLSTTQPSTVAHIYA
jgi:hypothetical protein